jgi:hypothetical protein
MSIWEMAGEAGMIPGSIIRGLTVHGIIRIGLTVPGIVPTGALAGEVYTPAGMIRGITEVGADTMVVTTEATMDITIIIMVIMDHPITAIKAVGQPQSTAGAAAVRTIVHRV